MDRVAFAAEGNQRATLAMSPYEQAVQDASRLSDETVGNLTVPETASIEQALTRTTNWPVVKAFLQSIPENERAAVITAEGGINGQGVERLKNGLLARTYQGEAGRSLAETFVESLDHGVRNIEAGVFGSLPAMARAESLIRAGDRAPDLSIAEDLAKAVHQLAIIKSDGGTVGDWLAQVAMFGRELTPVQERLLAHLDTISRAPRKVRDFVQSYADAVEQAPHPSQAGMFGQAHRLTKEQVVEQAIRNLLPPLPDHLRLQSRRLPVRVKDWTMDDSQQRNPPPRPPLAGAAEPPQPPRPPPPIPDEWPG